jgi:hypothetical protein
LLAILLAVSVAAAIQFRPGLPGLRPFLLLIPAAAVALIVVMELRVTVTPEAVRIHMAPFFKRTIARADIAGAEARTYSPIREYGGWGLRLGPRGWAYNVSGNRGVELTLASGKHVMIGSPRAEELEAAIRAMRG